MSYYAKIVGNMMTIAVNASGVEYRQTELPIGERLLDFVYYDLIKLNEQLDRVFSLCINVREIDAAAVISKTDEANIYLRFFSELLVDTLADGSWNTKQGLVRFRKQYPQEVAFLRQHPSFTKTDNKSVSKGFLIGIFLTHAMAMQEFLKSQLEFCMNNTSDHVLRDLSPTQRLYLYEQWRKSKGEQPLYFECESYSTRLLVDKQITFPADGSLSDWASLLRKENPTITEMAELPNAYALMRYEMMHMVMQDIQIKLCANCRRYFINTGRSDKEYCSRPIDGQLEKTCESVGALLKHQNRAKNSAIIQEYNTAYKRANSNKRIGNLTEKEFKAWSKEAREKRDLCLDEKIMQDEFVEWLNQDRIYKKRR